MMRRQRAFHARLWIGLALVIATVFAAALSVRERVHAKEDRIVREAE
jgi:hypothetical protein